jgi:hypothetical protein
LKCKEWSLAAGVGITLLETGKANGSNENATPLLRPERIEPTLMLEQGEMGFELVAKDLVLMAVREEDGCHTFTNLWAEAFY